MSKAKAQTVVLSQRWNQRKREVAAEAVTSREAMEIVMSMDDYYYKVERVTNTLDVAIGQELNKSEVQKLIDRGMQVTIQPVK
jgi:hypothetical protein